MLRNLVQFDFEIEYTCITYMQFYIIYLLYEVKVKCI